MTKHDVTHRELMSFARALGEAEYRSKLNYFRIMEYPLSLNLLAAEPGARVLEVGSGFVSLPPLWLAAERGCEVTAVDKKVCDEDNRRHIEALKKRVGVNGDKLRIVSADAQDLPFDDGYFDRISAVSTIEHFAPFTDAPVMRELGRVLADGGRLVLSVPFNLGRHIEEEDWGGAGYEQRHYTDVTLRERLIHPSGLHFVGAVAFGEIDAETGKRVIAMPVEQQRDFAAKAGKKPDKYWREYYRVEGEQFAVHRSLLPQDVLEASGLIAVVLEKRDAPLPASYFEYDPLESWIHNDRLTRNESNSEHRLTIDAVRFFNLLGAELDTFDAGETMKVAITFTAQGPVENPAFRILFHNKAGEVVAGLHTGRTDFAIGRVEKTRTLEVTFGMLNLAGGKYEVTVGAWDRDRPDPIPPVAYDVHHRRYAVVVNPRAQGLDGEVHLPHALKLI
ncbi:MAG: Wzt carbohydrate-binding domain-containing protein [Candidatus Lernaella stagnicola]|nr:Wzt carbohydrate-binding domain-containing protein [Candidatus Lernaella stagnicola]